MQITITQKDIESRKISFTDSGYIIDELAKSVGEYTSNEVDEMNLEYIPQKPYHFNYEKDLLNNTKTLKDFESILAGIGLTHYETINWDNQKNLQTGAFVALEYPEIWKEVLDTYINNLEENGTETISKEYNKALQEEIDSCQEDQYKEWLYGDRDWEGVVKRISKYYTETRDGEYDQKSHSYTFVLSDYDVEEYKEQGYKTAKQIKEALLDTIYTKGYSQQEKERLAREKRRSERERVATYQKEQKEKEEQERREELLKLTI